MGNKITALRKTSFLFFLTFLFGIALWFGYSGFDRFYTTIFVHPFVAYEPANISTVLDTSNMLPATGVPILMFHGIVKIQDNNNTTLKNFTEQMEMLKREGYQTISLKELDDFYYGDLKLPPKPIVLTFDDGRNDSYYPVDKILERLNFKATIFVATNRANRNDPFFLTWEAMKLMHESGRWDIQAHGRDAHNTISTGINKKQGKYLTSRMFSPEVGLESIEDYRKRVEQDYINGIHDIEKNLGYTPKYFAIPLNEYDNKEDAFASNYEEAASFNSELIRKYFKLAFIVGIAGNIYSGHPYTYTIKSSNPHRLVRIEPKNLTSNTIQKLLEEEHPKQPPLDLDANNFESNSKYIKVEYGEIEFKKDGLHLIVKNPNTTLLSIGQNDWMDYTVEARMQRIKGRSVILIAQMADIHNYVSFGMTDNGLFLRERVDGVTRDIGKSILKDKYSKKLNTYKIVVRGNKISASFNNTLIYKNVAITNTRGKVGLSTWGTTYTDVLIRSFTVHN